MESHTHYSVVVVVVVDDDAIETGCRNYRLW